jgi:hypothetical protein
MEPDEPQDAGDNVVSLDDARRKASAASERGDAEAPPPTVDVNAAEFLKPVMAAIARELSNVADPDGLARAGGSDEASRAKTAAVIKGLGAGLGQALAEAFGKWAQRIESGHGMAGAPPAAGAPPDAGAGPSSDGDPDDPDSPKPS